MASELTNEQLRILAEQWPPAAAELLALRARVAEAWEAVRVRDETINVTVKKLRARVAELEAALRHIKRYAEDHDDEWVPHRVDDALVALAQPAESGGNCPTCGAVGLPQCNTVGCPDAPPATGAQESGEELAALQRWSDDYNASLQIARAEHAPPAAIRAGKP